MNKATPYLLIAGVALDGISLGKDVMKDCKNGSTRNAVTTAASIASGWGGGLGGAHAGTAWLRLYCYFLKVL